ncbi:MAG: gliding motility protein GldN [Flavobacteriales bacterium]|jgi:gliding motility associated protien GldN|nr:gliding motility protein GldN [Flavobacteriales bacterium]
MAPRYEALLISAIASLSLHGQDALGPDGPCRGDGMVRTYAPLREADAIWSRRAWRVLDLNEPSNKLLAEPAADAAHCRSLIDVIRHGLRDEGGIRAFIAGKDGLDDGFRTVLGRTQLMQELAAMDTMRALAVRRYMIKEDWIFDKARSVMEVRIIGLAPMVEVRGELGELRGYRPVFWLYYPECRRLFAWWVAGTGPEGSPITYENILDGRLFRGTISKVSSMQDRAISATSTSIDALLESDAVRRQLDAIGFDLWHY